MAIESRLAELAVGVGANVQAGQLVFVTGEPGHLDMARRVAEAAYRRGARFVEVDLFDPIVQRARLQHAPAEALEEIPQWRRELIRILGAERGACVQLTGTTEPHVFDDLEPSRVARVSLPRVPEWHDVELLVNWTIVPTPTPAWATTYRPDLEPKAAYAALEHDLAFVCRLDEPDPGAAWRERLAVLERRAAQLDAMRLDAVRFDGPGTALCIGLLEAARWDRPLMRTPEGIDHMPNVPTEEVFTVPDPGRVDGHVRLTRPTVVAGRRIDEATLVFRDGHIVEVDGGPGVEALREFSTRHENAGRLGELALVDADSRVGRLGHVFGVTLLDENATSHIALGYGFPELLPQHDEGRANASEVHLDVMVGGRDVAVTGVDRDDAIRPLIIDGRWMVG